MFVALVAFCVTDEIDGGDQLVDSQMTLLSVAAAVLVGSALSGSFLVPSSNRSFGAILIGLINSIVLFVGTPSE